MTAIQEAQTQIKFMLYFSTKLVIQQVTSSIQKTNYERVIYLMVKRKNILIPGDSVIEQKYGWLLKSTAFVRSTASAVAKIHDTPFLEIIARYLPDTNIIFTP